MSQPSSDFEFDSAEFPVTGESSYEAEQQVAPPPEPAQRYRKQGFSIFTIMLILSFVCLVAALIILFIETGKYS
jgi:hypothetical protein